MTIFDILNDILRDKTGKLHLQPGFEKEFKTFGLAKWLSMRNDLMPYADFLNSNAKILTKVDAYKALVTMIPPTNSTWIKYIKKDKTDK